MPRKKATKKGDIGIENADPRDVIEVLKKVCTVQEALSEEFELKDLDRAGLIGTSQAKELREKVGAILGIGYGNGNAMVKKLNSFGISREAFEKAVEESKR